MSAADALVAFAAALSWISQLPAAALDAGALQASAARLVEALARASIQSVIVTGAIWMVCRLVPRIPAGARAGLWWLAGLQLLVGLAWPQPMTLAVLPPAVAARVSTTLPTVHDVAASGAIARTELLVASRPTPSENAAVNIGSSARVPAPVAATQETGATARDAALHAAGSQPTLPAQTAQTAQPMLSPAAMTVASIAAALLWIGVALGRLTRLAMLRRRLRQLVARAAAPPAHVQAAFDRLCDRVAPWQRPLLRVSEEVQMPQVSGARRPVILLPARQIARLSSAELSMTLCHELTHVTRGDLWLGWIPAIARELFFFHPLAALAAREYGVAREAACDAAVIQALDAEPQDYGRLLVTLGVSAPRAARHAPLAAAGSSSSVRLLKRRLVMLQDLPDRPHRVRAWWPLTALALVGLVPVQLVGQRESATTARGNDATRVARATSGVAGSVNGGVSGGVAGGASGGVSSGVAGGVSGGAGDGPVTAVAGGVSPGVAGGVDGGINGSVNGGVAGSGVAATGVAGSFNEGGVPDGVARVGAAAGQGAGIGSGSGSGDGSGVGAGAASGSGSGSSAGVASGFGAGSGSGFESGASAGVGAGSGAGEGTGDQRDDTRWVVLFDSRNTSVNGSSRDIDRARAYQQSPDEPLLWFRRDGIEYVIRDRALIAQAKEAFRPQAELGRQQGELGERQGHLGAEQGKLGEAQGRLGAQQGEIGATQGRLSARRAVEQTRKSLLEIEATSEKRTEADRRKLSEHERVMTELEAEERKLTEKQEQLSRQQDELGHQQEALGRKQEALGEQQEVLGRKQEEASRRAEKSMKDLLTTAVASGAAQKVK